MKILLIIFSITIHYFTIISIVQAFGGGDDKFIKKYAMMKIYESCFGPEVVRQIRTEMKAACAKCTVDHSPPPAPITPSTTPASSSTTEKISLLHSSHNNNNNLYPNINNNGVDVEKLHQAIMGYKSNIPQYPSLRPPFPPAPVGNFYSPLSFGNGGAFQPPSNNYPPFFFPGYQQLPFSPYGSYPVAGRGLYRSSRDMDLSSDGFTTKYQPGSRIRNVTCVMQELGYLDEHLQPNYPKINQRIGNLPIEEDLKHDMQDGVAFCKQFSQCIPEVDPEKSPLSRELLQPMFFFKCYKHKKLEACIMKDVKERYAGVSDVDFTIENNDLKRRIGRHGKKLDGNDDAEIDDLAASMYDFLYGNDSNGFDIDGLL